MLSMIIPTYNERENVKELIPLIHKSLKKDYEIIIVDDNSPDGTAKEAEKLTKKYPVRVLKRAGKLGLTTAIVDGFKLSKGSTIGVMDADLQHPPEALPKLLAKMKNNDIVIGSRNVKGGGSEGLNFFRKLVAWGAKTLAVIIAGVRVTDPMAGFFMVKRDIFKRTQFKAKGYKVLLNILIKNPKAKVTEVPILFRERVHGKSNYNSNETMQYLIDLFKMRFF